MSTEKKLKYRIAVRSESNHAIEAYSPEEAIRQWQDEMQIRHIPCQIVEQQWIKGGFRLVVELKAYLSQEDQHTLSENISINNVSKSGERIR